MKGFYKGPLVWGKKRIAREVNDNGRLVSEGPYLNRYSSTSRIVAIYNKRLYDLSDYVQTLNDNNGGGGYNYINDDLLSLFKQNTGGDITKDADKVFDAMTEHDRVAHKACLNNRFFMGEMDFRDTARCTVQGVMLLVFSIMIGLTILVKCRCLLI